MTGQDPGCPNEEVVSSFWGALRWGDAVEEDFLEEVMLEGVVQLDQRVPARQKVGEQWV